MLGTLARPDPNLPGNDIPIRVHLPIERDIEEVEWRPPRCEDKPRRTYLKREDFEVHHYMPTFQSKSAHLCYIDISLRPGLVSRSKFYRRRSLFKKLFPNTNAHTSRKLHAKQTNTFEQVDT